MYLESNVGTQGIRRKFHPERAYYNTGSCVHPRCITGIEFTPGKDGKPAFTLIKWGYAAEGVYGPEKPVQLPISLLENRESPRFFLGAPFIFCLTGNIFMDTFCVKGCVT